MKSPFPAVPAPVRHSRPLRIASAAVVVATLPLVGTAIVPNTPLPAAVAAPGQEAAGQASTVTQGTLSWGIKQSFRNYLTGPIAGGHWNLNGIDYTGGKNAEDGAFQFAADPASSRVEGDNADLPMGGEMTLVGHAGLINVTLSNIVMQIRGNKAQLIADGRYLGADVDAAVSMAGGPPAFTGEPVATFNLDETLTQAGAASGAATITGDSWIHENLNQALLGSYGEGKNDGDRFSLSLSTAPGGNQGVEQGVQIARSAGQPDTSAEPAAPATRQAPARNPQQNTSQNQVPATDVAQCGEVTAANVGWGIKESFRSYLNGPIAMGGWDLNGVGFSGDPRGQGSFDFTGAPSSVTISGQDADIPLGGSINMNGHFGALDITLSNMSVKVRGTTAQFIADYRSSTVSSFTPGAEVTGADTGSQVPIAEFTLDQPISAAAAESGSIALSGPGFITAEGNTAFGGNYGEGNNEADPLDVTLETTGGDCGAGSGGGLSRIESAAPASGGTGGAGGAGAASGSGTPDLTVSAPRVTGTARDSDTTCEAEDGENGVTDARMGWGIKESFRSYIRGSIANGDWTTGDGAVYSDGAFVFAGSDGKVALDGDDVQDGAVSFTGSVNFTGHDGILDTTVANPEIEVSGSTGTLVADVTSNDTEGNPHDYGRISVADLSFSESSVTDGVLDAAASATLTQDGSSAMGDFYEAGAEMDPLTLKAALSDGCDGEGAGLDDMPEDESDRDRPDRDDDAEGDGEVTVRGSDDDADTSADPGDSDDDGNALVSFVTNPASAIPSGIALIAVIVAAWLGIRLRRGNGEG
ncbi:MAG: HtaA domain-containing protein [Mycobacteriaceae bacterium]